VTAAAPQNEPAYDRDVVARTYRMLTARTCRPWPDHR